MTTISQNMNTPTNKIDNTNTIIDAISRDEATKILNDISHDNPHPTGLTTTNTNMPSNNTQNQRKPHCPSSDKQHKKKNSNLFFISSENGSA